MTNFHRNFIDFLTDHEKLVSDQQTGSSGCANNVLFIFLFADREYHKMTHSAIRNHEKLYSGSG